LIVEPRCNLIWNPAFVAGASISAVITPGGKLETGAVDEAAAVGAADEAGADPLATAPLETATGADPDATGETDDNAVAFLWPVQPVSANAATPEIANRRTNLIGRRVRAKSEIWLLASKREEIISTF
jgi:hypothetical protein